MKRTISLLVTLSLALLSNAALADNKKVQGSRKNHVAEGQIKSKGAQTKIYRHHEGHWQQPIYDHHVDLFTCRDSWGHKLSGDFTEQQQYFIQLGGGECRQIRHSDRRTGHLSRLYDYGLSQHHVYDAISQIRSRYHLGHAKLVDANVIKTGRKNVNYTLIFKNSRYGYREFKVKQTPRSGYIKQIKEV